ncbi:MAG: isoprenylcysteine carboxylmethyltransferase family protein [Candidatus Aminicenantes bacterium]|nr:isoprenylcysteine carboxylmethyltransferase family protein [Candidatus Aminicenantes bacterium]
MILIAGFAVDFLLGWWIAPGAPRISLLASTGWLASASLAVGALALLLGCWLGHASHGALKRNVSPDGDAASVLTGGPYGRVRHPFYLSLILIILSLVLLLRSYPFLAGLAAMAAVSLNEAKKEEARMMKSFGAEYLEYRRRTGMFLPRIHRSI